jgi:hypothetical protein
VQFEQKLISALFRDYWYAAAALHDNFIIIDIQFLNVRLSSGACRSFFSCDWKVCAGQIGPPARTFQTNVATCE